MKRQIAVPPSIADDRHALELHTSISAIMREFRLEPGLLAGSPYTGLHANDIGLFEVLAEAGPWHVRGIADTIRAPISTVSSALDRLEKSGLVRRTRTAKDRRVVGIELTARGRKLADRLRKAHVSNCRAMLLRLAPEERNEFLRLTHKIAVDALPSILESR